MKSHCPVPIPSGVYPGQAPIIPNHPHEQNQASVIGRQILVGGFNPSEKYSSKWKSSRNWGENKNI